MTTHQFFIRQSQISSDGSVTIDGPDARHIRVVLRLKKNSRIRLVDEEGSLHLARVEKATEHAVVARILETGKGSPACAGLTVIQGIPRLPKADLIVQKLTELGTESVLFVPARRSPYTDAFDRISKRLDRLEKIAESAAAQCSRRDIPRLDAYADLEAAVGALDPDTLLLMADESVRGRGVRDCLVDNSGRPAAVVIGPEGGLSPDEIELLEAKGAIAFSLGRNILRTETAAIVAAAIVLYEMGEI